MRFLSRLSIGLTLAVVISATELVRAEEPTDKLQLDFANGLYHREYYPMAAEEFQKYLAEHPTAEGAHEAWFRLAESLRHQKKLAEALPAYQTVADKFASSPYWQKSKYRVGEIYYLDKKYAESATHLQQLVEKATDKEIKSAGLFLLSKIQYDQGHLDAAEKALLTLAQAPDAGIYMGYSYFSLGQIALKKNDPDRALTYFKSVLDVKPLELLLPETTYEIARLEFNRRNYAASAAGYERVITDFGKTPFAPPSVSGLVAARFQEGKWQAVIDATTKHLDRAPATAQADLLYLMANAQRQLKQWDNAIATYDQIAQKHGTWDRLDSALAEQVRCQYEKQDFAKVVAATDVFLKKFPKSALGSPLALLAGEVQFSRKNYDDAARFFDVVLTAFPKSEEAPDASYRKAWTLLLREQWAPASEAFRSFLAGWPQDKRVAESLVRSAQALQRAGNFAEAVKDYATYNEKHANAGDGLAEAALYQMGLCQGELKQFDAMAKTLVAFTQKFPNSASLAEANYWLGWNAFRLKQWQPAVDYLTKSLNGTKRSQDAKLKLVLSYYSLDKPANAAPFAAEIIRTDLARELPLELYRWLAKHHVAGSQHAEALSVFGVMRAQIDAATLPGWAVTANLGYGESALALRKYDEALPAFQKVVELAPDSAQAIDAYLGQARVYLATQKFVEAEAVLAKVMTMQPEGRTNAVARLMLGETLKGQGKHTEAAKHFQAVALLFDDPELTPQALARAATSLEAAGLAEEATRTKAELKQRYPNYQAN